MTRTPAPGRGLGQPKSAAVLEEVGELRATVERVEALAFPLEDGGPTDDDTLSVGELRAALHPEEPHTPAQDASSTTDGSEDGGGGMRARTWVIAVTSGGLGGVAGALAVTGTWWPLAVWVALWSLLLIRHGRIERVTRDEEMRLAMNTHRIDENENEEN